MTDVSCPTDSVTPGKEVCNTCLMNGCDNCMDRCIPNSECTRAFTISDKSVQNTGTTFPVSFNEVDAGDGFPGHKYVCGISPDETSYSISGTPILTGDNLTVDVDETSYENGNFMASATFVDGVPTYPVGGVPSNFQANFDIKTANESFVLLQDIYGETFKKYAEFHNNKEELAELDFDFYSLRNLDPDALARNLFTMVKSIYKIQMLDIQTSNLDRQQKKIELHNLRKEIDRHRVIIDDLKATNATSKRNIEININKSRRVSDTNRVLMIVMIIVGLMIIVPILKKAGVMSLNASLGIWCVLILVVLGYMTYELYMKRANVDEIEYKKLNFAKPSDREVAKSRALAQMNDKDKARCQAYSELEQELDVPNINLDVTQYYSNDTSGSGDSCAHIPDDN
jgi:hypothetical protein